jgi:hypothetical protein
MDTPLKFSPSCKLIDIAIAYHLIRQEIQEDLQAISQSIQCMRQWMDAIVDSSQREKQKENSVFLSVLMRQDQFNSSIEKIDQGK